MGSSRRSGSQTILRYTLLYGFKKWYEQLGLPSQLNVSMPNFLDNPNSDIFCYSTVNCITHQSEEFSTSSDTNKKQRTSFAVGKEYKTLLTSTKDLRSNYNSSVEFKNIYISILAMLRLSTDISDFEI